MRSERDFEREIFLPFDRLGLYGFFLQKIAYKFKRTIVQFFLNKRRQCKQCSCSTFVSPFLSFFNPPLIFHSAEYYKKIAKIFLIIGAIKSDQCLSAVVESVRTNKLQLHAKTHFLLWEEVHDCWRLWRTNRLRVTVRQWRQAVRDSFFIFRNNHKMSRNNTVQVICFVPSIASNWSNLQPKTSLPVKPKAAPVLYTTGELGPPPYLSYQLQSGPTAGQ